MAINHKRILSHLVIFASSKHLSAWGSVWWQHGWYRIKINHCAVWTWICSKQLGWWILQNFSFCTWAKQERRRGKKKSPIHHILNCCKSTDPSAIACTNLSITNLLTLFLFSLWCHSLIPFHLLYVLPLVSSSISHTRLTIHQSINEPCQVTWYFPAVANPA